MLSAIAHNLSICAMPCMHDAVQQAYAQAQTQQARPWKCVNNGFLVVFGVCVS